jgi:hypothetical protein
MASFNRYSEEGVEPARDDNGCVVQLEPGVTPKRGQCLRYHQAGAAVTRRGLTHCDLPGRRFGPALAGSFRVTVTNISSALRGLHRAIYTDMVS